MGKRKSLSKQQMWILSRIHHIETQKQRECEKQRAHERGEHKRGFTCLPVGSSLEVLTFIHLHRARSPFKANLCPTAEI